jgi:hypothetical protein
LRKRIRNDLKLLAVNPYPLGFGITHALKPTANFVDLEGFLAGGKNT